ncbi:MAG TPA: glycosyltransferase family 1 protein [Anaerolineae bacterium]|nr:glycosyltransferase family 1 protein [Anaerolineae bacterium]
MPIYVDVSAAVHRRAGLGRYTECLARALAPRLGEVMSLFYNREAGIKPLAGLEHVPSRTVEFSYKTWRLIVWMAQLAQTPFNRMLPDARLFHATEHLLLPLRGIPTILTVHDLIFHHLPEHHKLMNRWYLNLAMPLFCRRADHIIAVSEATRRDLLKLYRLPPEKITVIYEAADPHFCAQPPEVVADVRARYRLPERYLLYVGTIEPRKNLTRLLYVWECLYAAGEAPPLVIVGKQGWLASDFFVALENCTHPEHVLLTGYVDDEDLPAVYAGATAFVFPSLYEGFGFPPLEAMACGAPVACSNTSSLPEVVGDAALTFNPNNISAMTEALRRILNDEALQAELRARGFQQAAKYSWAQTAQETLELYVKVQQNFVESSW